jgi:hypothetical protein
MLPPSGYPLVVRCDGKSCTLEPGATDEDLAQFLNLPALDGNSVPLRALARIHVSLPDGRTVELSSGNPCFVASALELLAGNNLHKAPN